MKKIFKNVKLLTCIFIFICLFTAHTLLAFSDVPFEYNIIPVEINKSIINTNVQKKIEFTLYSPMEEIYYNNELVKINNDSFSIVDWRKNFNFYR